MVESETVHFLISSDIDAVQLRRLTKSISRQRYTFSVGFQNLGGEEISSAKWLALVDSEITINFRELRAALFKLNDDFQTQFVYFNSSYISGLRKKIIRRPGPSLERLRSQDYLGDFVLVKNDPAYILAATLEGTSGSATKLALGLAAIESKTALLLTRSICAEPSQVDKFISPAQSAEFEKVLNSFLLRTGGGEIEKVNSRFSFKTKRKIKSNPLVSILIPTRARWDLESGQKTSLLLKAVRSVLEKTTYLNFELVVIFDHDPDLDLLQELETLAGEKLKLVEWSQPFDFSAKMNLGVAHSKGEYVLFLNDDVEVINPKWLDSMLALNQLKGVGMVGAFLYYEDLTIQHGGHTVLNGAPTHIGLWANSETAENYPGFKIDREVYGVTAACSMMPKQLFEQIGGFTSLLPGNFNDVDINQKIRFVGYSVLISADAELFHYESKTRDATVHYYELDVINHRWGHTFYADIHWPLHPIEVNKWV